MRRAMLSKIEGFVAVSQGDFGELAHVVIDAVSYDVTRVDATAFCYPGGVIAYIDLDESMGCLDIRRMTQQEITCIGTYAYTMADFHETAQAIFDDQLGSLDWVETRPLDVGAATLPNVREGRVASPKVVFIPNQEE